MNGCERAFGANKYGAKSLFYNEKLGTVETGTTTVVEIDNLKLRRGPRKEMEHF